MIISHLKNFDKYDENGQSTIHRIPLKWVLKAISKIVKEDDEIKKMCFSDHQLTKIIFDCFTKKEIRKNNIGQSDNYSNNKISILDHDKNNDEMKNYRIFEKKKKNL